MTIEELIDELELLKTLSDSGGIKLMIGATSVDHNDVILLEPESLELVHEETDGKVQTFALLKFRYDADEADALTPIYP